VLFRALTGAGIGGEYSAINSAIQEFTPPERRGRVDLFVNGSYWIGAALGALGSLVVLDPRIFAPGLGWRFAFIIGGVLAILVIVLRRFVPESPRWLMTHGRIAEAEQVVSEIEARVGGSELRTVAVGAVIRLSLAARTTTSDIVKVLLERYPKRTVLGLTLMASQAFCYNAIFFTYALILTRFYRIPAGNIGLFMLPFALGNFLGPLLLGPLFDRLGRKPLIAGTYAISAALLLLTGFLFARANLGATAQTALWTINFFFASAGASAAYLTVGECFPLEMRARAIAVFYAFGTAIGGILGPVLFGALIETGSREQILLGYLLGAVLMAAGAVVAAVYGVAAERVPLEELAPPLSRRD
jgi:MFS family permease